MSSAGFLFVFLAAVLSSGANLVMRAGIDSAGGFSPGTPAEVLAALVRLFLQPLFLAGFIAYLLGNISWFRAIASEPLSIAYPTLVSLSFFLLTGGAALFLGEPITLRKLIGLA